MGGGIDGEEERRQTWLFDNPDCFTAYTPHDLAFSIPVLVLFSTPAFPAISPRYLPIVVEFHRVLFGLGVTYRLPDDVREVEGEGGVDEPADR